MRHDEAEQLLTTWIENQNLQHHCRMVATAMMAYAEKLNQDDLTKHDWWLAASFGNPNLSVTV